MNVALLHTSGTSPTARRIAEALTNLGHDVTRTSNPPAHLSTIMAQDAIIRWGSSRCPWLDDEFPGMVINKANSIVRIADKYRMLQDLNEHDIPLGSYNRITRPTQEPIVQQRWSSGGRGILQGPQALRATTNAPYAYIHRTPINFVYEFRCIIHDGYSIRLGIKTYQGEAPEAPSQDNIVYRTQTNGWHIVPLTTERLEQTGFDRVTLRNMAKSMAQAFPDMSTLACDFGATLDARLWAIEVNSAPGLNDAGALRIATRFHQDLTRVN